MPEYADLWGLNPQTGRVYSVEERRQAMRAMGRPARSSFGPLPSAGWDEWFDKVNQAQSGLPEGFNASQYGGMRSPAMVGLNKALIQQARGREATGFSAGPSQGANPYADVLRGLQGVQGQISSNKRRLGNI